jgi:hypothetical protein
MITGSKFIKPAFTALLLSAGSASATLVCPGGQTYPQHGPGDYEFCPTTPTPDPVPVGDVTNTITNTANAAAISAAQAKARAKAIAKQRQKQRQRQQQHQRQSQKAYGGAGGTGGNSTVRNVGNVNVEAVANAPTMDVGQSMMGSASGSFLGVSFGRAKADVFPYMLQAGGDRIALAHLGNVHGPANKALRANGLAETTKERDARQSREARAQMMFAIYQPRMDQVSITVGGKVSYCKVIERHWNGVPSNIFATSAKSLPLCASYHGVNLK